jgi:hypothetical protein
MARLPRATTRILPGRAGIDAGINLATIWGCVPQNADITPRIWADSGSFEDYHGAGQLLDHLATYIDRTDKPAYVVPLPITTPGIIRWQRQYGTGDSAVTVGVGGDGSLERVDGAVRITRAGGGTVGTDQIQIEYSLDGGNFWELVRLSTNTSYAIPRTGQVLSFAPGTLVAGEVVLRWASTGPVMSDSDIAAGLEALKQQQHQSRGWFLVRDLEKEQDVSAYKLAADSYSSDKERHVQAHVGLRPARDRSGYKAQMSRTRVWMQGSPEITFTNATSLIERDTGDFTADGFEDGDWVVVAGSPLNAGPKLVSTAAALALTVASPALVDEGPLEGVTMYAAPGLSFSDASDTLVRNRGSWLDEGFAVGDIITIAGEGLIVPANAGEYPILNVTDDTITVAADSFVDEQRSSWDVSITVSVVYPVDVAAMNAEFAPVIGSEPGDYHLEIAYGRAWYPSPVYGGMRTRHSAAFHDFVRSFQRDLAETTWEQDVGAMANVGFLDVDGLPFEYDEDFYEAALAAGFTCLRTWPDEEPGGVYVARGLTRKSGSGPLTQSHYARVTNLGRTVAQRTVQRFAGKVIVTKPANALGQKFATTQSLSTLKTKVDAELTANLGGTTRGGAGPRASVATYTPATDTDYAQQNPVQRGTLRLEVLGTIVELEVGVEVI